MRFENLTPLPAALVPNGEGGDRIRVLVVASVACRVKGGELAVLEDQPPLLRDAHLPFPNDVFFLRERSIGVTATGFVYPARDGDVRAEASLSVGQRTTRVLAYGPRRWKRSPTGPTPSKPEPLERVSMSWDNAYGGSVHRPASLEKVDGEPMLVMAHDASFPLNRRGTGFALSADDAIGRPLAPLEAPDHPVTQWDIHPEPVCFAPCPLDSGLRAGFVVRDGQVVREDVERLASRAAPRTTFTELPAATPVALAGMRPDGAVLTFAVPESPVELEIGVGPDSGVLPMTLDCVDIDAEAETVRFVYRTTFGYDLVQHEQRFARLHATTAMPAAPGDRLGA